LKTGFDFQDLTPAISGDAAPRSDTVSTIPAQSSTAITNQASDITIWIPVSEATSARHACGHSILIREDQGLAAVTLISPSLRLGGSGDH
jgi:hypothetical protein